MEFEKMMEDLIDIKKTILIVEKVCQKLKFLVLLAYHSSGMRNQANDQIVEQTSPQKVVVHECDDRNPAIRCVLFAG